MPSVSKKQHNLMAMVANNPKAAKRLDVSQSVGKEFMKADKRKGKKFALGGPTSYSGEDSYDDVGLKMSARRSGDTTDTGDSDMSFKEAFRRHRLKGDVTFTWRGKKYTTETKEDKAKKADRSLSEVKVVSQRPEFSDMEKSVDRPSISSRGPSTRVGMRTIAVSAYKPAAVEKDVGGRRRFMAPGARREREKAREASEYKEGGSVKSSASRRADGTAQRGKTRGKFV